MKDKIDVWPTMELRWEQREQPDGTRKLFLQQKYIVDGEETKEQWRDIPVKLLKKKRKRIKRFNYDYGRD